jgi:SAM-dependent methyltransferase
MNMYSPCVPITLRGLHEPPAADPVGLLDAARARLRAGDDVGHAVDVLSDGLWWLRNTLPTPGWREVIAIMRAHPLLGLLHENPMLRRAYCRPLGYSGDAKLIDMLYFGRAALDIRGLPAPGCSMMGVSPLGLALLDRDAGAPAAVALRERREFFAGLIDHVAETVEQPAVLVMGCGHFREGMLSRAVRAGCLARLVCVDQDEAALDLVAHCFEDTAIETVNRGVRVAMDGSFARASFDMIYAGGLYDYLPGPFAQGLTTAMFGLLRPGGRLVISNPVPGGYDAGYIEACGDWFLSYRTEADMLALADRIAPDEVAMRRVYTRQSPDISYLELRRRRGVNT